MTTALERLFEREKKAFSTFDQEKIEMPDVIQTLSVDVKMPPPSTPTLQGDARLRGILKKPTSNASATSPVNQAIEVFSESIEKDNQIENKCKGNDKISTGNGISSTTV